MGIKGHYVVNMLEQISKIFPCNRMHLYVHDLYKNIIFANLLWAINTIQRVCLPQEYTQYEFVINKHTYRKNATSNVSFICHRSLFPKVNTWTNFGRGQINKWELRFYSRAI